MCGIQVEILNRVLLDLGFHFLANLIILSNQSALSIFDSYLFSLDTGELFVMHYYLQSAKQEA